MATMTSAGGYVRTAIVGSLLLMSLSGCSPKRLRAPDDLARRSDPPGTSNLHEVPVSRGDDQVVEPPVDAAEIRLAQYQTSAAAEPYNNELPAGPIYEDAWTPVGSTLALPEAIELAFRQQPRLRVYLETVEQARRGEDIAFAPFLPMAATSYSVGTFDLNVGGTLPGFSFLPGLGALPFGLNINTGYELADLKMQWLICDFGRRIGRHRQAGLATQIAHLQTQRAYQTVANDVTVAYYQLLRTQALKKSAIDAVRRAEDDLDVAQKLAKGGALEREKVLRVEVQLAEMQRLLDAAEGAEAVAVAALNLAIGLNVTNPTSIQEYSEVPELAQPLTECLATAISQRREFQVASQTILVADAGHGIAKASFAPKIVGEGLLFDYQQSAANGRADMALGFIKLEWGLFEGGRRVAELRVADSKLRAAMAEAESIADTISFQVTEAYRHVLTARKGIDRSRPAVTQAEENYRLVRARAKEGDATTAEITDAESTLTRAQQNYLNSIHDYLIALSRLDYAMGVTPTPGG